MRGEDTLPSHSHSHQRNLSTTTTTAREDFRRHARRKSSSGLNNLHDTSDHKPSRLPSLLPSRIPSFLRNMHPPSFRQLLVASTVLVFFLFLSGRRLWATHTTEIHDEWAKPQVPVQQQQPPPPPPPPPPSQQQGQRPADSSGDGSKTEQEQEQGQQHETPLQQVPWHWNAYPP